jgi:hypothetical protein
MKVEVLYVADCPSHPAAVKLLTEILCAEGIAAEICEVLVSDERMAARLGFCGSPTIRVNGLDVAGDLQKDEAFALSCRLYSGSTHIGLPPPDVIRRAVIAARGDARP